jgi:hypothetical protein
VRERARARAGVREREQERENKSERTRVAVECTARFMHPLSVQFGSCSRWVPERRDGALEPVVVEPDLCKAHTTDDLRRDASGEVVVTEAEFLQITRKHTHTHTNDNGTQANDNGTQATSDLRQRI